jgi:23S rRNA pseudouridine2457 synthase
LKPITLAFHKPYLVLSQFTDRESRQTLGEYISIDGVYSAGRLDYRSEGLLILSNQDDILHRLTDPIFQHTKTYCAQVEGLVSSEAVGRLKGGPVIPDQEFLPVFVGEVDAPNVEPRPVRNYHPTSWLKVVLCEGKKHQVRRMTAAVGLPTLRLVRTAIGGFELGNLAPGTWQILKPDDIQRLFENLEGRALQAQKSSLSNGSAHGKHR